MNRYSRSFISEIQSFQEEQGSDKVKVWVTSPPEWLPDGVPLILNMKDFTADTLKGIYYYPGKFDIYVTSVGYDIKEFKYIFGDVDIKNKCTIS